MSDFDEAISSMDIALFNEFSVSGRYQGSKSVDVILDRNAEQFGTFETTVPARRHEISFLNAQITDPKRGHSITVEKKTYLLDGEISDDGFVSRWHLNEA